VDANRARMPASDHRCNNPELARFSGSWLLTVGDHLASNVCGLKTASVDVGIFS